MEISPLTPDGGRKGDLVRLPSNIDLSELQDMLDYLRYKELTSTSKSPLARQLAGNCEVSSTVDLAQSLSAKA